MPKLISYIVPVYNEEANLSLFYGQLFKTLAGLGGQYDWEIIFVNDGSQDKSGQIIEGLAKVDVRTKYLEFSRNFGKEVALSAGLRHCRGEAAILIDADLEHPPEVIPQLLEKWRAGADVVIGLRKEYERKGFLKKIGSFFFYKIMGLIGETKLSSRETDFRLLDRKVIQEFNRLTEKNRITRGLIDWLGFKRDFVEFDPAQRRGGRPAYTFWKLTRLALYSFVSQSLFSLKLAGYLGILITFFGGSLGLFMFLNRYIFHWLVFSGPAMLAVFNLFLIGIVLICLGLIAIYIANIHQETLNRPMYVIRKKSDSNNSLPGNK